jgi:ribonuclease P protein component
VTQKHEFKKNERLKSAKVIGLLFKKSDSFAAYPVRIVWREMTEDSRDTTFPIQMALTVPKKTFKTAVARNVLRRRIREAYRLHKHLLYENLPSNGKQYGIMLIYTGKEEMPYSVIEQSIKKIIRRFVETLNKVEKN